jgi:hypothetical protein
VALLAVTVRREEEPLVIERGLAVILTVVTVAETLTIAVAEVVPLLLVAVAVYVVVAAGLTDWRPPVTPMLYVDPSLPVTVTWVASVAAMVSNDV